MSHWIRLAAGMLAFLLTLPALSIEFDKIERHTHTVVPAGEGPFPVVFLVPGCGGFSRQYEEAQSAWAATGLMTIRIDLIAANNAKTCRDLSTDDAISDTISAIKRLSQSSNIKSGAINVMGISWGGAITLAALSEQLEIDAAIVLFPACRFTDHLDAKPVAVPVLALHGEADKTAPLEACRGKFAVLENLELITFPGAPHSFLGLRGFKSETQRARQAYQAFFRR